MSPSTVTYTSVYFDYKPWRFQWVSDVESQSPEEAPQSPEQEPPSPDYVPGPEHPPSSDMYLVLSTRSYVANTDPKEDLEEDPEEDPADYPVDGEDDEKEDSFKDDNDEEEDASKEDEDEEEEHLAPIDSVVAKPTLPQTIVPVFVTRLHRAQIFVRPHTPPSPSTEALIAEFAFAPTPPSPPPSLLSPLSSSLPKIPSPPLHTSPAYAEAPLGYRAAMI
uniref:Uncharacterized protein n=1 Tax=Tanacetum cinerariifolium TaxID=118510 RepID=A0A6L2LF42_TANCI|nr:hypothetical protein [Tanacetum cinerariifolium]